MNCPHCGKSFNLGKLLGSSTSPAKAKSSKANGRRGGRRTSMPDPLDSILSKPHYTPAEQAEIDRNQAAIAQRISAYA